MKRLQQLQLQSNQQIAEDIFRMVFRGDDLQHKAGQFVQIEIPGFTLRRPISVADSDENSLTLYYKVIGEGTKYLSRIKDGSFSVITHLGNGFEYADQKKYLLIGGGLGTAPMLLAAKQAVEKSCSCIVVLGFRNRQSAFLLDEFSALPIELHVVYDEDGENVCTEIFQHQLCNVPYMCCGPMPMMKAVKKISQAEGQLSLEERMGCGFGACMGCSIKTVKGMRTVCNDGPVFFAEDLLW